MTTTIVWQVLNLLLSLSILVGLVYLFVLLVRALRKYLRTKEKETVVRRSLGTALKEYRIQNHMTQEFVAQQLNVSRQAVSKWETGASDPSTANLLALAKLYGISPGELLKDTDP